MPSASPSSIRRRPAKRQLRSMSPLESLPAASAYQKDMSAPPDFKNR
jgi:hypothetical protein